MLANTASSNPALLVERSYWQYPSSRHYVGDPNGDVDGVEA